MPELVNIDADPRQADWVKQTWDLPTDPETFVLVALHGNLANLPMFMRMPVADAMPASLRAALGVITAGSPAQVGAQQVPLSKSDLEHLAKYSEDQPRDEGGRWTGGSSSTGPTARDLFGETRPIPAPLHDAARTYINLRQRVEQAQAKADTAFRNHFDKLQAGEPTSSAQATRLQNEADYLSADLFSAEQPLYAADFDPDEVWAAREAFGVKKYSDDQPRDEQGRWTDGGGGVPGGDFHAAIQAAIARPEYGGFLTPYSAGDYGGMRTFLAEDGKVGGALKDHGGGRVEIVSLFNVGGSPGAGGRMVEQLKGAGGNYLECFDGFLPRFYADHGFAVLERFPWDEALAPPGWPYGRFGRPDYVTMALPGTKGESPG